MAQRPVPAGHRSDLSQISIAASITQRPMAQATHDRRPLETWMGEKGQARGMRGRLSGRSTSDCRPNRRVVQRTPFTPAVVAARYPIGRDSRPLPLAAPRERSRSDRVARQAIVLQGILPAVPRWFVRAAAGRSRRGGRPSDGPRSALRLRVPPTSTRIAGCSSGSNMR